jgi:hypothetical protein
VETTTSLVLDARANQETTRTLQGLERHRSFLTNRSGGKILCVVAYRLRPPEATMKFSSFALTALALASSTNGFVAPAPRFAAKVS